MCNLDKLVKISIRQGREGPQPTVLKNAMFALVAAVWLEAGDWSHTLTAMTNLGCVLECTQSYLLLMYLTDVYVVQAPVQK